jgi:hypothetical protein
VWDKAGGGWGHLTLDHVVMGDVAATVRSDETAVNLVMDGQVVASATGANSEYLDWQAFDLRPYAGKTAHIEIVDNNRFGWGHILADEFRFGDAPAPSRAESYDWLDYGRDYYAAVSWNTGKLYVDRTHSGKVDFHPAFSSVEDARVAMVDGQSVPNSIAAASRASSAAASTARVFRDLGGAAGLQLADEHLVAADELALRGIQLELGARVGDVEVAHGQLADPVDRAEGGVLDALHRQLVRVVAEVLGPAGVDDRVVVAAAQAQRDLAGDAEATQR